MDKSCILERLAKVFVVAETTIAEEVIDCLRGEVLERVRCIGDVARPYVGVCGEENECFSANARPWACGLWVRRGSVGREKVQGAAEHGQGNSVDPVYLEALAGRP